MKLTITADIDLDSPSAHGRYVTWLDVAVADGGRTMGVARVALVHVGEIADAQGDLWPTLQGTPLEGLHDVYFEQGWYRDDYADGAGIDLLHVASIELDESCRGRNVDLAIVRRLAATIGSSCQLVTMAYRSALEAAYWAQLGFGISTAGRPSGYMHMKLGYRHAQLVASDLAADFRIVGSQAPSGNAAN